jgi:hypothetical protein
MFFSAAFTPSGDLLLGTQEYIKVLNIMSDTLVLRDTVGGFNYSSITSLQRLKDSDWYLAGTNGSGLYKLNLSGEVKSLSRLSGSDELAYLDVQAIYEDQDDICWISTNGSGVLRLRISPEGADMYSSGFIDQNSVFLQIISDQYSEIRKVTTG